MDLRHKIFEINEPGEDVVSVVSTPPVNVQDLHNYLRSVVL